MNIASIVTLSLRIGILLYAAVFAFYFIGDCIKHKEEFKGRKHLTLLGIGCFTDLLDTLGIGCFATTQASFKLTKSSPDNLMPGTLNVGHALPVITEFVLFLGLVEIAPMTLISMIVAAIVGSLVGANVVSKWSVKVVRIGLGCALIFLAIMMILRLMEVGPFGSVGMATGLTGIMLATGIIVNFFLGALMTIGVGLYTPCIALCSSLGLNIKAAFPIMFGSCAFLMPSCGFAFVKKGTYDRAAAAYLTVGGIIGVFIAFFIVKELPLTVLTWIIVVVMLYTAFMFFRDVAKNPE